MGHSSGKLRWSFSIRRKARLLAENLCRSREYNGLPSCLLWCFRGSDAVKWLSLNVDLALLWICRKCVRRMSFSEDLCSDALKAGPLSTHIRCVEESPGEKPPATAALPGSEPTVLFTKRSGLGAGAPNC
jgi:hypothetical protein